MEFIPSSEMKCQKSGIVWVEFGKVSLGLILDETLLSTM